MPGMSTIEGCSEIPNAKGIAGEVSTKKARTKNRQTMRSSSTRDGMEGGRGNVTDVSTHYLSSGNVGGIGSFEVREQKSVSKA